MPKWSSRAVSSVVVASLVLLGCAAAALVWALSRMDEAGGWVSHTYQVIAEADALRLTVTDAETGQRGYLLTDNQREFDRYQGAANDVSGDLSDLRRLIVDNPDQTQRLARIAALIEDRIALLGEVVRRAQSGDREGAIAIVRGGRGTSLMDEIRTQVAAFSAEEERLLAVREAAYSANQRLAVFGAIFAVLAAVLAASAMAVRLLRSGQRTESRLAKTSSELQERSAELRAVYDTAPVGLAYIDEHQCIVAINTRLARIYGRPVSAISGLKLAAALPELADDLLPIYHKVLGTGEPVLDRSLRGIARPDEEPRQYLASYWPVRDRERRVIGVNVAVLDITERRRAEEDLQQLADTLDAQVAQRTAELTVANEQLEAFTYTVSHDLRAPLRGMEGFARILLDDFADALGPQGRRYAERIVAATVRMERLIGDLLTYSRLQRAEIKLRAVDPAPIVRAAVEDARSATPNPAAVDIDIVGPLPEVLAEPMVLGQVVLNLLTNAVKFHEPEKPATVRIRGERRQDRARLCVEDQGIGIAPEHLDRIFAVFERLHGQEAYAGTGIGLAIVKAGVERMGGACGVESEAGHGALFWIELKAA